MPATPDAVADEPEAPEPVAEVEEPAAEEAAAPEPAVEAEPVATSRRSPSRSPRREVEAPVADAAPEPSRRRGRGARRCRGA